MCLTVPCRICGDQMPFSAKSTVCDKPECQALKNKGAHPRGKMPVPDESMPVRICKRKGCKNEIPEGRKYYCSDDCRKAARKLRNLMELRYGTKSRHNNNRSADGRYARKPVVDV